MCPRPVWAQTNLSYLCTLRIQRTAHVHARRRDPHGHKNPHITLSLRKKPTGSSDTWTAQDWFWCEKYTTNRKNNGIDIKSNGQKGELPSTLMLIFRLTRWECIRWCWLDFQCCIMTHLCLYNSSVIYPYQASPFPWNTTLPHMWTQGQNLKDLLIAL